MNTIIVACDPNFLIGTADNKIPWSIPDDMKFFRETTTGHAIVMGRKTYDSFPKKPLPKRLNVVLSKTHVPNVDGDTLSLQKPVFVRTLPEAFEMVDIMTPADPERFIIGGAQIYRLALQENLVDKILMTKVRKAYEGAIYFPDPAQCGFKEVATLREHPDFTIVEYRKA
jgi:dihydrofolate reductase